MILESLSSSVLSTYLQGPVVLGVLLLAGAASTSRLIALPDLDPESPIQGDRQTSRILVPYRQGLRYQLG